MPCQCPDTPPRQPPALWLPSYITTDMETPSPGATLSAVIAEDRRREARRRQGGFGQGGLLPYLVPACGRPAGQRGGRPLHSELMVKLHRWGATFLPKGGGAVARELEEPCRAPSPPPRPRPSFTPAASAAEPEVVPRHEAPAVSVVPTTGPSREREEPAAGSEAIAEADMSAGESAGSSDHQATPVVTVAGGSGGTWLRASPKTRARSPSLQTDSSDESPRPLADSAALPVVADDKYVWADKYRPNVLNEFICNKTVAAELYQLVGDHTTTLQTLLQSLPCSFVSEQLLGLWPSSSDTWASSSVACRLLHTSADISSLKARRRLGREAWYWHL